MKDKLVTLIGGGGFVGRYVAQELLKAGARVRIAQRDPRQAWFLKPQGGLGQTQFVAVDVRKPDSVARAITGSDMVVNLVAAFANMQAVNVEGADAVAKAAAAAGVQAFVHISAIGADANAASEYGRTKGEAEARVRAAFPNATILRPSIVFGREDQFINRFAAMVSAPVVPVIRAQAKFQPVLVSDLAEAVVRALAQPLHFGGNTYEIGGPDVLSMGGLIRWLADATGHKPMIVELPDSVAGLVAALPFTPISRDQLKMLQSDNVVSSGAQGLSAFGITPKPLATVAPAWLVLYRRNGRFGQLGKAA